MTRIVRASNPPPALGKWGRLRWKRNEARSKGFGAALRSQAPVWQKPQKKISPVLNKKLMGQGGPRHGAARTILLSEHLSKVRTSERFPISQKGTV